MSMIKRKLDMAILHTVSYNLVRDGTVLVCIKQDSIELTVAQAQA